MQHISELIKPETLEVRREEKKARRELDPKTIEIINKLFLKFASIFPAFNTTFKTQAVMDSAKVEWTLAFMDSGINSVNQLEYGVKKARLSGRDFMPNVGQFIEWCTPTAQDLGFPNNEEAYLISIRMNVQFSDYKHPDVRVNAVIRHAINQIGTMKYREMKAETAQKVFKTYYAMALNQFCNGELKEIPKVIEDQSSQTEELTKSKAVVKEEFKAVRSHQSAMDAIKNMLK